MNEGLVTNLAYAILLLPLASAMISIVATRRVLEKGAAYLTTGCMGAAFVASLVILFQWLGANAASPVVSNIPWIPIPGTEAGWLYLGVMVDSLTVAMLVMVTLISLLVHIYSIGYMHGDKRFNLFFAYLSLFSFSMLGIVLANSVMMIFVFWELVGLTSYLLIGFWFEKKGPQLACKKAFVMNRIGDMGFLIGFGILFMQLGGQLLMPATEASGNMFAALGDHLGGKEAIMAGNAPWWLTLAGIGLFFGAIGKSAQFPLHTWLPDAMEGPTPVSSIVHSATMVAAGVYLTGRIYPILTPEAHLFISTIGLVTLVIAACMALVMTDIKRVLAYSTLSQLGYMILGLGAGAWAFALFHLITHAFFKCCLFQCSGSVIHAAHHQQDMRYYGGLLKKMPVTAACYFICTLAIAGASIPYTAIAVSGYYSKDGIIAGVVNYADELQAILGGWANLYWLGPMCVAYLTVFYMARSFALTFLGKPRDQHLHDHAHEAPITMLVPQIVLAAMAILSAPALLGFFYKLIVAAQGAEGWVAMPMSDAGFVATEKINDHGFHAVHAGLLHGISWILVLVAGLFIYSQGMAISSKIAALPGVNLIYAWFKNKFYFDALYDIFTVALWRDAIAGVSAWIDKYLVDGIVNLTGTLTKLSAFVTGAFDLRVVDGAVNGAANVAQSGGAILRGTQAGRVRLYVTLLFAAACVITLVVVTTVMVMG
jgi:NADH-quinone oxidoreductase subunit L